MPWRWVLAIGMALGVVKFSLRFIGHGGRDAGGPGVAGPAGPRWSSPSASRRSCCGDRPGRRRRPGSPWPGPASCSSPAGSAAWTARRLPAVRRRGRRLGSGQHRDARRRSHRPAAFMPGSAWCRRCRCSPCPSRSRAGAQVGAALAGSDPGAIGAVAYLAFAASTLGFGLWGPRLRPYAAGTVAPFALLCPGLRARLRRAPARRGAHRPHRDRRRAGRRRRAPDPTRSENFSAVCVDLGSPTLARRSGRRLVSPQTRRLRRKERGHRGERPAAPSATVLALAQRAPQAAPFASFSSPRPVQQV